MPMLIILNHATDALKTVSQKVIQKTATITVDLIDNKIADKLQKSQKLHHRPVQKQLKIKQKILRNT